MKPLNDPFQAFAYKAKVLRNENANGVIIYTRVSTKEQAENGGSLETQLKACNDLVARRKFDALKYFGGTYESAKTDDRKEFNEMIAFAKSNKNIKHVIVYSYDRFSRTGNSAVTIIEDLNRRGITVISATQEVDTTTSAGALQQDMLVMLSKFENQIRKDKSVSGMQDKLRKGFHTGAVPFGYTNLNPGKGKNPELIINRDGELLRQAFNLKAKQGLSYPQIAKLLEPKGWHRPAKCLSDYMHNPFYCGKIVSSHIPSEVHEGKHPPLISEELFLKVHNILASSHNQTKNYSWQDENLPLKGFLTSASCNVPVTGYLVKKKGLYYYKTNVIGACENRSAKVMHEEFTALLSMYEIMDHKLRAPMKDAMISLFCQMHEENVEAALELEKQFHKIESEIKAMEKQFVIGITPAHLYDKYRAEYEDDLVRIQTQLVNHSFNLSNLEKAIDVVLEYALNLPVLWDSSNLEGKHRIQNFVFPAGLVYDFQNRNYRTDRVHEIFAKIPVIIGEIGTNKKRLVRSKNSPTSLVRTTGVEPAHPKAPPPQDGMSTNFITCA